MLTATRLRRIQDAYPYCDVIINAIPPIGKVRSYPDICKWKRWMISNKALENWRRSWDSVPELV